MLFVKDKTSNICKVLHKHNNLIKMPKIMPNHKTNCKAIDIDKKLPRAKGQLTNFKFKLKANELLQCPLFVSFFSSLFSYSTAVYRRFLIFKNNFAFKAFQVISILNSF